MARNGPSLPSRYADREPIASGGMGDVVRAKDGILGRTVAIKVLAERYRENEEFQARFMREAQMAASLTGEAFVVAIHDVGENEDGLPFIVMEYAPGGTLAERLRAGPPGRSRRSAGSTRPALRSTSHTPAGSSTATSSRRISSSRPTRRSASPISASPVPRATRH